MLIKVNGAEIPINGKKVYVKIVRDSKWCRWLNKDIVAIKGKVFFRAKRLRFRDIHAGLDEIKKLHSIGYIRYYWNLLTLK